MFPPRFSFPVRKTQVWNGQRTYTFDQEGILEMCFNKGNILFFSLNCCSEKQCPEKYTRLMLQDQQA